MYLCSPKERSIVKINILSKFSVRRFFQILKILLKQTPVIMHSDPIADYLTRLRNAIKAKHRIVEIPTSNIKKEITKVLFEKGYIQNYKFEAHPEKAHMQGSIKIAIKYNPLTKDPAIVSLKRISKPGLRKYVAADKLPRVLNGLGVAILSTSKGVMTDKEARTLHIGGEVLCHIY